MIDFSQIHSLEKFQELVDRCELRDFNKKGDKRFSYGENLTVSRSTLVKKLDTIYRSKYFPNAQLSEVDCEKLKKIITSIEKLDSQTIQISKLQSCKIKIAQIVIRIFRCFVFAISFGKCARKNTLFEEIAARSQKPTESILLKKIVNSELSQQVMDALDFSYENYYKKPYKDSKVKKNQAVRTVEGTKIHRYNHGLAHSTRKAFYIPFVIDYISRHGKDHLSVKIQELADKEGLDKLCQKLQLAITFEVAGRESECGSRDNLELYTKYLDSSSKAFINYCEERQLIGKDKLFIDQEDVQRYASAIKDKYPNKFLGENMDVITAILDMAHTLDEFRCYWPSRMNNELKEIDQYYSKDKNNRDLWELAKFCQKAVKVTGDRLMTEFSEGINERGANFLFSDFKSKVFRNFSFTNKSTFLNCSTNAYYCRELLEKIPPPISFSRGETTFSHLLPKLSKSKINAVESKNNQHSAAEEALNIISNGDAAIRLVNSKAEKFGFEMRMLNDPVFFRPIRPVNRKRNWILIDRVSGTLFNRKFKKDRSPLTTQIHNFSQTQLGSASSKNPKPVNKDENRGLPKFTEYTKKLSLTLLRPDSKINHFKGEFPKEYGRYCPVGFLYNLNDLEQKNQKYIFDKDVGTSSKFWIGKNAKASLSSKEGRATNLTLEQLKSKLQKEAEQKKEPKSLPFYKMQHAANEILVCPKKTALKALFATKDTPQMRTRTFLYSVYMARDYGIHLPILVLDGKNPAKAYSKQNLHEDLKLLSTQSNSVSKKIFNELYSCFFSPKDNPNVSKRELSELLYGECTKFFDK